MMKPLFGLFTGVVKFFDSRNNKRFGFIVLEDCREVFFHFDDGRIFETDDYGGLVHYLPNRDSRSVLECPKVGDRLYFRVVDTPRGPKANLWTSETHYQKAVEDFTCPCSHYLYPDHRSGRCDKCDCPDFGMPLDNWEEIKEVNVGDGPGGFKIYE